MCSSDLNLRLGLEFKVAGAANSALAVLGPVNTREYLVADSRPPLAQATETGR